jgi:hypothetical protein
MVRATPRSFQRTLGAPARHQAQLALPSAKAAGARRLISAQHPDLVTVVAVMVMMVVVMVMVIVDELIMGGLINP